MTSSLPLDRAGRRRSRASMPGHHRGRPPRNKGLRYPADPPTVDEIVAVMRAAGQTADGTRLRALIVVLWRAGLRISEALALAESDIDPERGAILVRHGKGDKRREVGMDRWVGSAGSLAEASADHANRTVVLRVARADARPPVRAGNDSRPATRCRRACRGPTAVRAPPAAARPRGRDVSRRRPPGSSFNASSGTRTSRSHPSTYAASTTPRSSTPSTSAAHQ
jgi:integrase